MLESLTPLQIGESMHDLCLQKVDSKFTSWEHKTPKVSHFVQRVFLTRFYHRLGLSLSEIQFSCNTIFFKKLLYLSCLYSFIFSIR